MMYYYGVAFIGICIAPCSEAGYSTTHTMKKQYDRGRLNFSIGIGFDQFNQVLFLLIKGTYWHLFSTYLKLRSFRCLKISFIPLLHCKYPNPMLIYKTLQNQILTSTNIRELTNSSRNLHKRYIRWMSIWNCPYIILCWKFSTIPV